MKHWNEFLPKYTHETKKLGKISNSIDFDIKTKEFELQSLKDAESVLNAQIVKQLLPFYSCPEHLITEVVKAQKKAKTWNTTPTNELQNLNNKK